MNTSSAEQAGLAGGIRNPARGTEVRVGLRVAGPRDGVGRGVINRCGIPACRLGGLNAFGTGHYSELRLGGPVTLRVVALHPAANAHAARRRGLRVVPRQNRVHVVRPAGFRHLQFVRRRRRRRRRVREAGAGPNGVGEAVIARRVTAAGVSAGGIRAARAGLVVWRHGATWEAAALGRFPARVRPKGNPADLEAGQQNTVIRAPVHVAPLRSSDAVAGTNVAGCVPGHVGTVVIDGDSVAAYLGVKERRCQFDGLRPLHVAIFIVAVYSSRWSRRVVALLDGKVARAEAVGFPIRNARAIDRHDEAVAGLECLLTGRWDRQDIDKRNEEHSAEAFCVRTRVWE